MIRGIYYTDVRVFFSRLGGVNKRQWGRERCAGIVIRIDRSVRRRRICAYSDAAAAAAAESRMEGMRLRAAENLLTRLSSRVKFVPTFRGIICNATVDQLVVVVVVVRRFIETSVCARLHRKNRKTETPETRQNARQCKVQ